MACWALPAVAPDAGCLLMTIELQGEALSLYKATFCLPRPPFLVCVCVSAGVVGKRSSS
jgi:hypothetical protein